MSRKLFFVIIIFVFLSSLLYVGLNPVVESTNSYPVWNQDTGLHYATIQEAINANETLDGHELLLENVVFHEHVVVNKSVELHGMLWIEHPEVITTINGNGTGTVVTVEADGVIMDTIKITNGVNGTVLEKTDNCILHTLIVVDNAETGIFLYNSRNCTLKYNEIAGNLYGIYIQNSSDNTIYHNKFINNTYQVHIEAIDGYPSNTWDDCAEGNYWSDYQERYPNATEMDGTDIWDTPYVLNENNQDNYPIVPEFPSFIILPLFMIATLLAAIVHIRKHPL